MKKLFGRSFVRALIITVISALVIVGGIYAYQTLWSGKAHITIEPPSGEGGANIEVTSVHVHGGTWDDATKTWEVSLKRGEMADIIVRLINRGSDIGEVSVSVNGRSSYNPAPGVEVHATNNSAGGIPEGAEGFVSFTIDVSANAEPGTLPEVQLELRVE